MNISFTGKLLPKDKYRWALVKKERNGAVVNTRLRS